MTAPAVPSPDPARAARGWLHEGAGPPQARIPRAQREGGSMTAPGRPKPESRARSAKVSA